MGKKVLLYSTHFLWGSHHQAKELEIMEEHLNSGDQVTNVVCDMSLSVCDVNLKGRRHRCLQCIERRKFGKKVAGIEPKEIQIKSKSFKASGLEYDKDYKTHEQLQALKYKNFDVGYAVASTIIHDTLDSGFDLKGYRELIFTLSKEAIEVYETAVDYYEKHEPDLVYFFNGRFAHVRAVLRALQSCDINFRIFEGGHDRNHYELFDNATPHSIEYRTSCIVQGWEKADLNIRENLASQFFIKKIEGKETNGFSFTDKQKSDKIPENWDENKTNIGIFNSSENEFESIGQEWKNPIYKNQNTGIYKVLDAFKEHSDTHFYLRVHPNLSGNSGIQIKEMRKILAPFNNLTIIEADSEISSYALLKACNKILTFGSSIGIEGTFWGKAVIQAGKNFAMHLNCTYVPENHEEVIELIAADLIPKPKENALKYGYYMSTFGMPYKNYEPNSFWFGRYKGVELHKRQLPGMRIPNRIKMVLPKSSGNILERALNSASIRLRTSIILLRNKYSI